MSHPRSSTNSYVSKEFSLKSQIGSELPPHDSRFLSNESDSMWQNNIGNNSATLPLRTTSNYRSSYNRSSNMNSARISSINYVTNEPDLQWQNNSNRIETRIMTESPNHLSVLQSMNSSQLSPNINDNRDQFSIFGSYKKHVSEKRDNSTRYESAKVTETQQINFKGLPVKQNSTISNSSSGFEVPNTSGLMSSGFFSPQISQQNTLQDLVTFNNNNNNNNNYNNNDERKIVVEEMPIKSETQKQAFSAIPILTEAPINNKTEKDEEIKKLNKTIDKLNNKMKSLQQSNEEMKNHLKNLLNERKNLIKQIENSEFEEIIEEEEVQRAKPNIVVNENQNQQKSIGIREEIVKENYIEKHKIGLQDLPKHILNNYRQDIIEQEREKMELEKRTLLNTLQIQYQQKLQSIEHEKEIRKTQVKHVSIQSYKNRKFNETSSDVNFSRNSPQSIVTVYQPTTSSKKSQNDIKEKITKKFTDSTSHVDLSKAGSFPRSIVTVVQPNTASKQSQNESIEESTKTISRNVSKSLNEYLRKSEMNISNWQKEMLERFLKSLESNDAENLSKVIREILLKQTKSVEIHSQPVMVSRLSQNESSENSNSKFANETFSSFTKSIKKSHIFTTKYQDSILERFMDALKTNNSDLFSSLIEELLFKPSKTVGINSVPDNSNKNIQTQQLNFNNVSHEVNIVEEKPKIEKSSKSITVKPISFHKGIQPDEKFYFETGTMTDHLFYRSQGVNTLNEYSKSVYSPYSETDSYVTRTSSRSEARKEFKSQTISQSSTNNLQKPVQKLQEKIEIKIEPKSKDTVEEWEQTFLVKEIKNSNKKSNISMDNRKTNVIEQEIIKSQSTIQESAPKPKEITEEWVQNIEEKVQVVTAHVDKDQNVKEDTPTTVECWETISKIKDGKLIEKKECYRDKYVSSDPEEIIRHLESHSHDHHDHSHSTDLQDVEKSIELHQHVQQKKENIGDYTRNFVNESKSIPINSNITETSYSKNSKVSSSIPIQKSFNEGEISKFRSYTNFKSNIPIGISQYESSSVADQHSQSNLNENVSIAERIEKTASSKSFNSPITFSAFSSRSNSIKSSSQQIEITSNTKSNKFSKPVKIENSESTHSKHGTNINVKTFSEITPNNENKDSSVIGSDNSAFYSLSELPKPPKDSQSYDYHEVLLPENIFQICNQILLWLNNSKHVCINNSEHLPKELIQPSIVLIDWWVDMVVKLTSNQLLSTIQYLISTFSKNFVKFLVINRDQQGNTCIHYIIGHQYWDSFSVLHATGLVDPNIYNEQGFTIMMLASTLQVTDDILSNHIRKLAQSANLNLQSKDQGQTAIYLAALHDNDNTIDTLYALGADINIRDRDENTPLMIAIERNNIKAVKAILSCPGVLLELKNKEGNTALKIAEQNNLTDIVDLFNQRKSIRRTEMSSYSNILQSGSNPTSPRSFRKFIFN